MYTGKPPFDWIISSMPQGITGHGSDPDGYIEAQVPIPADLSVDEYDIKLTVTDSEKNTIAEPVGKLKVIGTPTVAPPGSSTPVSELSVEPSEVKAGEPFTVKSKVPSDAGTDYEISLDPPVMITNNKDNVTTAGPIEKRVVIPADTTAGDYTVKLRVTDSMGKTLLETGKLKVIPQ
jgi:uncharacterized membrane protein